MESSSSGILQSRRERVEKAALQWANALIDLGGRNNLIYYRDLKVGTLDLADAEPAAMTQLHAGRKVRLTRLFPPGRLVPPPLKNARRIRDKIRELDEERGIRAGYLAIGMATWSDPEGRRVPNAPVLLRAVKLDPVGGAQDDFDLELAEEVEVNPVLVHLLEEKFGVHVDAEELAGMLDLSVGIDARPVFAMLEKYAGDVSGFAITYREVVGTFSYAKLPMVEDLQANLELLAASDVIAAIAGDPHAQSTLYGEVGTEDVSSPDDVPPDDEYLVLDADSSQSRVVNAVVAGSHLVVKGPPGTGKSQTITNLIATLIARGMKVLFVAEKRAAIDVVLRRLDHVGLGELVMDLHDGASHRRRIAESLARSLNQAGRVTPPNQSGLHRRLEQARGQLSAHDRLLHTACTPWQITPFQAQAAALGTPSHLRAHTRFFGPLLQALSGEVLERARVYLREYVELGGLDPATAASPWARAQITTPEQAEHAYSTATQIATVTLPSAGARLDRTLRETGLRPPVDLHQWREAFALLDGVARTLARMVPEVYAADFAMLCAATGSRSYRRQNRQSMGWLARRRLIKSARGLCRDSRRPKESELHRDLCAAAAQSATWSQVNLVGGPPRLPADLPGAETGYAALIRDLQALGAHLATTDLLNLDPGQVGQNVAQLAGDVRTLSKLPRLNQLKGWLLEHGFGPLLAEASSQALSSDEVLKLFADAWHRSILDHIGITEPKYGTFTGQAHSHLAAEFVDADARHRDSSPHRIQRAAAETLVTALNGHQDQARLIRAEAAKRSRHKPIRDLWRMAPDVLLAAKPCWAMSPLIVSQILPASRLFDVVIFDEASQVQPADAVCSLMRASRAAVAGDEHQLPPTSFFAAAVTEDEEPEVIATEEGSLEVSLTTGYESILEVLHPLLPWRSLTWHYRSRDERLIAFSNAHIYDSSLVTFPGVAGEGCLRHVHVHHDAALPGEADSVGAEVSRVVDLVIEHVHSRPKESLGVITMGIKHKERIEAALRERRSERRDLDDFFAESGEEPFFVKNLERVQGDERDAIVLSVGYGKGPDGRMRYRWGPLNNKGGERRLNVAVTRAKTRLTVVSSFTAYDIDPNAIRADGAKLLRAYLEFAESGGENLGSGLEVTAELNPFEIDVRDRLRAAGIPLVAQYGVSGYRIDFAAAHPTQPGRMVLAVEADGASYHSAQSARDRDRLRQQHLENLGWTFHRIWSTDWFRDPVGETAKARGAYDQAVARADAALMRPHPDGARETGVTDGYRDPDHLGDAMTRAPRPHVRPGLLITDYTDDQLRRVVRYVTSDGLLRTDDEILRQAMAFLGFQKAGSRIRAAIERAIRLELTQR